jgi:hypothetical protein
LAAELIVVLLGVFIALAADGWREDLEQAQEERLYLDRLSEDLDVTLNVIQFAQGRLERARDATFTLIEIQEAGEGRSSVDPDSLAALYIRATDIEWVPFRIAWRRFTSGPRTSSGCLPSSSEAVRIVSSWLRADSRFSVIALFVVDSSSFTGSWMTSP